jgi:hypothetical protein
VSNGFSGRESVDVHHGIDERVRCLLREVVADATRDQPVRVLAGELLLVRVRFRMRCAVGVAFESDGGDGDARERGEARLDLVQGSLAGRQSEPPPIVVDGDGYVVGVVERRRAALEGGVVEALGR